MPAAHGHGHGLAHRHMVVELDQRLHAVHRVAGRGLHLEGDDLRLAVIIQVLLRYLQHAHACAEPAFIMQGDAAEGARDAQLCAVHQNANATTNGWTPPPSPPGPGGLVHARPGSRTCTFAATNESAKSFASTGDVLQNDTSRPVGPCTTRSNPACLRCMGCMGNAGASLGAILLMMGWCLAITAKPIQALVVPRCLSACMNGTRACRLGLLSKHARVCTQAISMKKCMACLEVH